MNIRRHPEAEAEMEASAKFYDERLPGLGREFVLEIQHSVRQIELFPPAGRRLSKNIRQRPVRRFSFNVLYAFDGNDIFVIAIMHQSRKPGYWKKRTLR